MSANERVYKFGCRRPDNETLALQCLAQGRFYYTDMAKAYNDHKWGSKSSVGDSSYDVRLPSARSPDLDLSKSSVGDSSYDCLGRRPARKIKARPSCEGRA